ncbi:MAG: thioredoxin family protein [Rhizobacter sp.]|nr:thioredoxin family protein [Chlorobiales bacterium]
MNADFKTAFIHGCRQIFAALFFAAVLGGCSSAYQVVPDTRDASKTIAVGKLSWPEWKQVAAWPSYSGEGYTPDTLLARRVAMLAEPESVSFVLIGGTWCGDSKSEMPKVFKLFDAANIPLTRVSMYATDRKKVEPSGTATRYAIEKVPTLIVLKYGKESGRIVEHPKESWEKDLALLLEK